MFVISVYWYVHKQRINQELAYKANRLIYKYGIENKFILMVFGFI